MEKTLIKIVGEAAFCELCKRLGGKLIYIPNAPRRDATEKKMTYKEKKAMARKLFNDGKSISAIAEKMNTTEINIYKMVRRKEKCR